MDVPQLQKEPEEEEIEEYEQHIYDFETESNASNPNSEFKSKNLFKKNRQGLKGMFSMMSEAEVTESKDDPMRANKENHDGIFKKVSYYDEESRMDDDDREKSPNRFAQPAGLKMMKARTRVEDIRSKKRNCSAQKN